MITEDVIQACSRYDRIAQRKVYDTYYSVMLAIVRRYIRDDEEVLDVVNQGFIKVFQKVEQYHFENSFEGWCKRIVINTALDHLRSSKRYKDFFSFDAIMPSHQIYNDGMNNMSVDELMLVINSISPISKLVFNMFAIDGYSHKEIADRLNISVGTSKWHLSSARKQIQSKLKVAYPDFALLYG
ncbi:MAG: sigma-70 family RNA polymerase sigma factor [Flavobacteriales bacterium]|nr:sigma-70 family RNA polymerase sigma factor [Flavobacteriales bacterium]